MADCYENSDDKFFEELEKNIPFNISDDIDLFKAQMLSKGFKVTVVIEGFHGEENINSWRKV